MSFDQRPIIGLAACPEHRPDDTEIVHTGPEGTDPEHDLVAETLMCWRCWESDEAGILALLNALAIPFDEIIEVRRHAFSKKPSIGVL